MLFSDQMPKLLEKSLSSIFRPDQILAAVSVDMNLSGHFKEEWLIVTTSEISVYVSDEISYISRIKINLCEIIDIYTEDLVGGGALIIITKGQAIELLRYTNAKHRKVILISNYIDKICHYDLKQRMKINAGNRSHNGLDLLSDKYQFSEIAYEDHQDQCANCNLPFPEGSKICLTCTNKWDIVCRMIRYLKPYKRKIAVIWITMIIGVGLTLIPPYLTQPLTDKILNPVNNQLSVNERLKLLSWLVVVLIIVEFIGIGLGILRGRLAAQLSQQLSQTLRGNLFRKLQTLSLRYFDSSNPGALTSRIINDAKSLEIILVESIQLFFSNIFLFIAISIVLAWINWKLTLMIFIPAPIIFLLSKLLLNRMILVWRRSWRIHNNLNGTVNDSLVGIRIIRAFAREEQEIDKFNKNSSELYDANLAAQYIWVTYFPMLFFIISIGNSIVWYIGGYNVILGTKLSEQVTRAGEDFTLGRLLSFLSYLGLFYGPLQFMSRVADYLSRALVSAERIFEVLDTEPDIVDQEDSIYLQRIEGKIEFKNVTFGYQSYKPILKKVSFTVEPGEMVGIVGHSGAGKSTTINLLCRFYDVLDGEITIDGINIKRLNQSKLRSQIGLVHQEPFLFGGSIYENISFAQPQTTRENIIVAAKAANAHDFIINKIDGYDTKIGEGGQLLSRGEKQRISIARAILHNPRILILDEATASVDTETENKIQNALSDIIKSRSTIVIAHKLSTIRCANKLVVLKDGEVVEIGSYDQLMSKKGEFYHLFHKQQEINRYT